MITAKNKYLNQKSGQNTQQMTVSVCFTFPLTVSSIGRFEQKLMENPGYQFDHKYLCGTLNSSFISAPLKLVRLSIQLPMYFLI